jgi:sulfur carrier protein ThiS
MNSTNQDPHMIEVRLIASLKKYSPLSSYIEIFGHETVSDVIHSLGIDHQLVKTAFLDGKFVTFNTKIGYSEKLLLLPVIGGG